MLNKKRLIKKEKEDICSPDSIFIVRWNLDLYYNDPDSVCISLTVNGEIICEDRYLHALFRNNPKKDSFDVRLWKKHKIITFWADGKGNYLKKIKKIKVFLENNNIVEDIDEYHVLYEKMDNTGSVYIVDCPLSEIDSAIEYECFETIVFNSYDRGRHLIPPSLRKKFEKKRESRAYYLANCKYWKNKIGNLDVAHYHLLIYEE